MFTLDEEKSVEMPEEETTAVEDQVVEEAVVAEPADDKSADETPPTDDEDVEKDSVEDTSTTAAPAEDSAGKETETQTMEDKAIEDETVAAPEDDTSAEETTPDDDEAISEGEASEEVSEESGTPVIEEEDDGRAWYVVHCYSGYENKVRHNLEQRIETMGMKDQIFDVVVPTEEEIEVKDGKRKTVERRVFPGYILVNMLMSEESWYVVRNTPGVTSFVGMGNEPVPLRPEEVSQIIKRMEADAPRIKVSFRHGERVRIIDGPFNDFRGTVDDIDMERAKVRVMVNFFGRETPVELDFLQVEKA
jgi:transcriptional antiterminator NusG